MSEGSLKGLIRVHLIIWRGFSSDLRFPVFHLGMWKTVWMDQSTFFVSGYPVCFIRYSSVNGYPVCFRPYSSVNGYPVCFKAFEFVQEQEKVS